MKGKNSKRNFLRNSVIGVGLVALLGGCGVMRKLTTIKIDDWIYGQRVVYSMGNPDIMEVYNEDNELVELMEDYNHNNIIGDLPEEQYIVFNKVEELVKERQLEVVWKKVTYKRDSVIHEKLRKLEENEIKSFESLGIGKDKLEKATRTYQHYKNRLLPRE